MAADRLLYSNIDYYENFLHSASIYFTVNEFYEGFNTVQKMKFYMKDFFSKSDQIRSFLCEKFPNREFFLVRDFPYSD